MGCIQSKRNNVVIVDRSKIQKAPTSNNYNDNDIQRRISSISVIPFRKRLTMDKTDISNQETQLKMKDTIFSQMMYDNDRDFILKVLQSHFLFKEIAIKALNILLIYFKIENEPQGSLLFNESDTAEYFCIIKEGAVAITSHECSKVLMSGESFGEMALFREKQQTSSATCRKQTSLYMLKGTYFRDIVLKMNENELKKRLDLITSVPLFKQISSIQLNTIASLFYKFDYAKNEIIIKEGDTGDSLYIITRGRVKCIKNNETIRFLKEKDSFGEYALLFDENRSHTIVAYSNKVICYQLCKSVLIEILGKDFKDIFFKGILKEALNKSQYLKLLSNEDYLIQLYCICYLKTYKEGDIINNSFNNFNTNENDKNKQLKLCALIEGNIIDNKKKTIIASRGELFGEEFIHKQIDLQSSTFIAQHECQILEFEWSKLVSLLNFGVEEEKTLSFLINLNHLRKISLCKNTSNKRLIEICKMMKKEKFPINTIIFKEGDNGEKLYLMQKGKIEVTKEGKVIRTLEKGNCFGELALLVNSPRSATIKTLTDVTLYSLMKNDFEKMIESNMLEYLSHKIALQDNFELEVKDLYYCKPLGKGKFGSVSLVHNKKNYYAIKAIDRKSIEKRQILLRYFIEEKKVLLKLDHPFIVKLVRTFKNEQYLFYLMEFVNGKTLDKCIMKSETDRRDIISITQFIIGSLLIIIDYLNHKKVCHRDLKPENLIIDNKGFLKLIDFGTSTELNNFTNTVVGTPHYMAPEVLIGKGYSFSCDYWSIGIIFYELLFNCFPFGDRATDPIDVYKDIFNKQLHFPSDNEPIANNLIAKLLKKKENERLCLFNAIKNDHFFNEFKWNELIDLSIESPLQPQDISVRKLSDYTSLYLDYLDIEQNPMKNRFEISEIGSSEESNDKDNEVKDDDNQLVMYQNLIDDF